MSLRQQPGIEQAAMVAIEGENGSKRLVAYLIPSSSPENGAASVEIDVESLRVRLAYFFRRECRRLMYC